MIGLKVTNGADYIQISAPDDSNITTIQKTDISFIGMYFQNNIVGGMGQSYYSYGRRTPGRTTKTIIKICLTGSEQAFSFDCDEVINQAGWQGCTNAALLQAHADITSWL